MELTEIELNTSSSSNTLKEDISTLIYNRSQRLELKNFKDEVRGPMDVFHFLSQSVPILLDLHGKSLSGIVDRMLEAMSNEYTETESSSAQKMKEEAKQSLFTPDSVHQLANTIQGTETSEGGGIEPVQVWVAAISELASIQRRHVAIARLASPVNMGRTTQEIRILILVLAPMKEKGTKTALETGRTFATLFNDVELRNQLLSASNVDEFKKLLLEHTRKLIDGEADETSKRRSSHDIYIAEQTSIGWRLGRGIVNDLRRRLPHYKSDYVDGVRGQGTLRKVIPATFFLYFACLLPSIAFGVLNAENTKSKIGVWKVLFSQAVGSILFALIGGQPILVLLTTAPLALYTKVIFSIAESKEIDSLAFYSCVGLWNAGFLLLYSGLNLSKIVVWSTRSTEELFALFISVAFTVDSIMDLHRNFDVNYHSSACSSKSSQNATPSILINTTLTEIKPCLRETSLLYLILLFGTIWLSSTLYQFRKSPFLDAGKREFLSDYALPVSVLIMSFLGSYIARDVPMKKADFTSDGLFNVPAFSSLPIWAIFAAMGLGFALSLLFFIDQNIASALVNSSKNKLKKGPSYHWDLFVVGIINALLSLFGLAWIHGALPHSPLHLQALAESEERVDQGHVYNIVVKVHETRLTTLVSHVLILLTIFLFPEPLYYIPIPVLYGLFVFMATTALNDNQLFERILLFVTEQAAYPPNHYIRRVPQRKIHQFTLLQLCLLSLVCIFGFVPVAYVKLLFPVVLFLILPARHILVPKLISAKYLSALDGHL